MAKEMVVSELRNAPFQKMDLVWNDDAQRFVLYEFNIDGANLPSTNIVHLTRAEFIHLLKDGLHFLEVDSKVVNSVFEPLSRRNVVR